MLMAEKMGETFVNRGYRFPENSQSSKKLGTFRKYKMEKNLKSIF